MLPFPRMAIYGNVVQNAWYTSGSTLVAYDSKRFNPSGFTDYMNNTMRVGNVVFALNGSSAPSLSSTSSPFGSGINLNQGYISTLKDSALGVFTSSWCLDMYVCQNVPVSGGTGMCPVIWVNNSISAQEFNTRFEIDHLAYTNVYDNSGSPMYVGTVSSTALISTVFYHYAVQYLNNRIYIFKNGVLIENFAFTITGSTWKDLAVIGNFSRANPSTATAIIDRYRLRTGQYFDIGGFDLSTIYPGSRIS